MTMTFQAGTTVIVSNGTTSRELLVSSCTASQTFLEESRAVKTLHSLNNIEDTFSNSKSAVSLEFDMYLTPGDSIVLEWFGMSKSSNRYTFSHLGSIPIGYSVYIKTASTLYEISNCILSSMIVKMDGRSSPLGLTISATGGNLAIIPSLPALTNTRQVASDFITGGVTVSGFNNAITGITLEAIKSISWVQNKTLHGVLSGSIYTPQNATIEDFSIGGTLTRYKLDDVLPAYSTSFAVTINYAGKFVISLTPCKRLSRWDTSDVVHKVMQDFKLLPNVGSAYMEFI